MSSSDDDDAPRGLGLGYGVKRGRRDRDEAALGVFGDGDEPHQRRGLGSKAKKSSGPVMFVSAGKEEAKPPAPAPAPTMSNDDFRAHMAPPPPPKAQKPKPPPTTATRPEWARHTKGVGFELMKKMGFTGRLGKDETGVSRHVEVTKRPDGVGLGFAAKVGFVEEAKLPQNIALQKELGQKVAEDVPVEDPSSSARRTKRRRLYRDAAAMKDAVAGLERAARENRKAAQLQQQQRVDTAVSEALAVPAELRLASRFREDLAARLNGEESALRDAQRRLDAERSRKGGLDFDLRHDLDQCERLQRRSQRLQSCDEALAKVEEAVLRRDHGEVRKALQNVKKRFPEEWVLGGVAESTPSVVREAVLASLEEWDPFLDATRLQAVTDAWGPASLFSSEDDRDACAKKWRLLIEQAAGPRTRSALGEWRPGANAATDAAACVLVNGLRSNAPDAFLASVIAPRIVTALETLARTAVRGQRCDARWAGPWPDLLDDEGRDAVRRAARVLLRAQLKGALLTDDRSLLKAFAQHAAAWKASLGSEWKPFITQDVLKTLVDAAKTLEICEDEDYQRWQVVDASRVVASIGVRGDDVAAVVKGALGPRFVTTLRSSLIAEAWAEAGCLYCAWRDRLLSDDGLPSLPEAASNAAVEVLTCGLDLISLSLDDPAMLARAPLPPLASLTFEAARQKTTVVEQPAPPQQRKTWRPALDASGFAVFADVVQRFAAENDVLYAPKPNRTHDGKQLYAFGRATIYLDRNVTFVKRGDGYVPVALEDLLAQDA
jgi:tuftelin-interacting protein 11